MNIHKEMQRELKITQVVFDKVQIRKTFLDTRHEKMSNFQVAQKR